VLIVKVCKKKSPTPVREQGFTRNTVDYTMFTRDATGVNPADNILKSKSLKPTYKLVELTARLSTSTVTEPLSATAK
jgi:hypothetical protein